MPLRIGIPAPALELANEQGEPWRAAAPRALLLNFFSIHCPWCASEMPRLAEVYRRHGDIGMDIVGLVEAQTGNEELTTFLREKSLQFPVYHNDQAFENYAIERVPTLVLVGGNGQIASIYEGASEQLSGVVEQTILAFARGDELPTYHLIGSGCAVT